MAGLEPARAFTAQRILSPLRLPFRHIGAAHFTRVTTFNFFWSFLFCATFCTTFRQIKRLLTALNIYERNDDSPLTRLKI